jgi:hypothetical protein
MRKRRGLGFVAGSILAMSVASTAFAAHCNVPNKPEGAGQKIIVLIDPVTGAPTFLGTNAAGRLIGGFAKVYLDADRSGTLTGADILLDPDDVFIIANHSGKFNPAQGAPAVLPAVQNGDPAGRGMGVDG